MKLTDSSQFTKEQLDAIVTAFIEISDTIRIDDYIGEVGSSSPMSDDEAVENYRTAKIAVFDDKIVKHYN